MHLIENVQPIVPGFRARLPLAYPKAFAEAYELMTGELEATFRYKAADKSALLQLLSEAGDITREAGAEDVLIGLQLSADDTANLEAGRDVMFSLVRVSGAQRDLIPGVWSWPIRQVPSR